MRHRLSSLSAWLLVVFCFQLLAPTGVLAQSSARPINSPSAPKRLPHRSALEAVDNVEKTGRAPKPSNPRPQASTAKSAAAAATPPSANDNKTPVSDASAPPVPAPAPLGIQQNSQVRYSFEFSKAEVQDVVKAISDITQHNFIIPERVKGQRISILSPVKVTAAEAYQVFFTALAANGISIVRVGKFYKLVDSKDAIRDTVPTCIGDDGQAECNLGREQMVTALLRMRFVDAAQVNQVARALLSKDGDITVFTPSNALIISEYSPNLRRMRRIIEALDVSGLDDALRIVQVQYASAAEVAEKLTQIFDVGGQVRQPPPSRRLPAHGGTTTGGDDSDVQISKIVPDDRTNQIIIKANRRSFDAILHLIHKIDVPISEAEHGRVHVYYLENAKAEDLSGTLSNLTAGVAAAKKMGTPPPGVPAAPRGAEGSSLFEGEVKITADKATNAILVMCSAHDYRAVRAIIEKLDVSRRQVYVEAAILEVKLQNDTQLGVDYHMPHQFGGNNELAGSLGFFQSSQTGAGGPSPTFKALIDLPNFLQAAGGAMGGLLGKPLQLSVGANNQVVTVPSFGAILRWLATTSNANVLSTPHLLTTDNQEAQIQVGETVPFNSGLFGGQSGMAGLAGAASAAGGAAGQGGLAGLGLLGALGNQIQRIPVLLTLKLTPQINESNKVRMELDQQIEDITGKEERTQTPTTSKRSIKTTVVVDDQQTIVLGGLIKDSTTISDSKIPFFGDLPLLGFLFKQRSTKQSKTNLMLILTPYIINAAEDFQRIFERKMREHEEFAAEYYGHRKEYRAHVDYHKKSGPLGRMVSTLRRERDKLENGGIGDGSETLIAPSRHSADPPGETPYGGQPAKGAPQSGASKEDGAGPDIPEVPEPGATAPGGAPETSGAP